MKGSLSIRKVFNKKGKSYKQMFWNSKVFKTYDYKVDFEK